MSKFQFDKKQLPQIIVLGVLALGLVGYFVLKLIAPPATQAAGAAAPSTATVTAAGSSSGTSTGDAAQASDTPAPAALIGASAPSDIMHDPFAADPGTSPAAAASPASAASTATLSSPTTPGGVPPAPALPAVGDVKPLTTEDASSTPAGWTVTGIVDSDADKSEAVAIFRSGDERRYVRLGNMIDDRSRLVGIDRDGVTIMRGGDRIRMALGVAPAPDKPAAPASPGGVPAAQVILPPLAPARFQAQQRLRFHNSRLQFQRGHDRFKVLSFAGTAALPAAAVPSYCRLFG